MRIVVTGATGNVGTAVLRALAADDRVRDIVGLARRLPDWHNPRTRWVRADVTADPLEPHFDGADAVGVDRVGDVAHHGLDLHPVSLLQQLDDLLALGGLIVAENSSEPGTVP